MRVTGWSLVFIMAVLVAGDDASAGISTASSECMECHRMVHPGMVADWERSRHAQVRPREALERPALERRVSAAVVPDSIAAVTVGCAECHTLNADTHKDTFEHAGYQVHVVVTPKDCAVCHPVEAEQFGHNLMSYAHTNLNNNPVYKNLADTINGVAMWENGQIIVQPPDEKTEAESCNYCHGTKVEVRGIEPRQTMMDEMEFPALTGWPNQGVGRINPDDTRGSCAACHTRHQFAVAMARRPDTCSECHKGPDVPAYPVYKVSKHGNIYSSLGGEWDFEAVPWRVGQDFTAPTCAVCHVSLLVNKEGEVIAERSHQMNNRLPWRIFGLIYAHPHPKSPDTTVIKNRAGLPLPAELTGEPASPYLIYADEQDKRRETMQHVCLTCHSSQWVEGQWSRFERTIETTNELTRTAIAMLLDAWEQGLAQGLGQNDSIFNEAIEKKWIEQWLFYGNSTRFAAAMAGADYGVFANGRWKMTQNIAEMHDWLRRTGEMRGTR